MESLAKIITANLISWTHKSYPEEDIEVFNYGMECFLNSVATDIILLFWGMLTHTVIETICWLFTFCVYRHYAGGAHAKTNGQCIVLSSLLGMSNFIAIHFSKYVIIYQVPIFIFLITMCILFAPTKSTKIFLSRKERLYKKFISLSIISICIIICQYTPITLTSSIIYSLFIANILLPVSKRQ